MIAHENFLGVRAAQNVLYCVIASPVGTYFAEGVHPIDIWVTDEYSRAGIGGTGAAKCGGNYASSLIAQYEGYDQGCSQVLFIQQTVERVDELGGMNVFLVTREGGLVTPARSRAPSCTASPATPSWPWDALGLPVEERRIGASELFDGITSGEFVEAFLLRDRRRDQPDPIVQEQARCVLPARGRRSPHDEAPDAITDIQFGRAEDTFGWLRRIA